uniref:Uncharacterized protein n=1 Tax=Lepeophtheirus salmonis TaxID=72036 RepID=A0A0K2T3P2_LEPSM
MQCHFTIQMIQDWIIFFKFEHLPFFAIQHCLGSCDNGRKDGSRQGISIVYCICNFSSRRFCRMTSSSLFYVFLLSVQTLLLYLDQIDYIARR